MMELPRKFMVLTSDIVTDLSSALSSSDAAEDDHHERSLWLPFADNASLRCPTQDYIGRSDDVVVVCQEQSMQRLVWRVLYWIKRIVLRLTHSYHADTAVLLLLPLITGILIGIWIGRRMEKRAGRRDDNKDRDDASRFMSTLLRGWYPTPLVLWMCDMVYRPNLTQDTTINLKMAGNSSNGSEKRMSRNDSR